MADFPYAILHLLLPPFLTQRHISGRFLEYYKCSVYNIRLTACPTAISLAFTQLFDLCACIKHFATMVHKERQAKLNFF